MPSGVLGQVGRPGPTPLGHVDPAQERGDDLAQLDQHHRRVGLGLGQRVGRHAQQQRLVGLARAVDPDVRQRACRQDARARRRTPWPGSPGGRRSRSRPAALGVMRRKWSMSWRARSDVGVEEPVHVGHVAGGQGGAEDLGVPVVAVAAAQPLVVGDVAGRLLEVGGQAAPLEHLGQQVRRLLAGQVDAAELGHRVVAVLDEHPLVELLGPARADGGVELLVLR